MKRLLMACTAILFGSLLVSCYDSIGLPPGTFTERVPMRYLGGILFVHVYLNGRTELLTFLLDTGSSLTNVDDDIPERFGLDYLRGGEGQDAQSVSQSGRMVKIDELRIGGLTVSRVSAFVLSMNHLEGAIGKNLDGIIGGNIYRHLTTSFDYTSGEVTFSNDPSFFDMKASSGTVYSLQVVAGCPAIAATFANGYSEPCVLDTGNAGLFVLSARSLDLSGLGGQPALICDGIAASAAFSSIETGYLRRARGVRLGPFLIAELDVFNGGSGSPFNSLGNRFLSRYEVVIDYPSLRVAFVPRAGEWTSVPFQSTGIAGLSKSAGGDLVISGLWRGSPAVEAGLRLGDTIVSIDGEDVGPLDLPTIRDLLLPAGTSMVRVGVSRDGAVVEADLAVRALLE